MHREILIALGGVGGLMGLFGVFLLLWQRYQYCAGGCRLDPQTRRAAWALVVAGAALVAAAIVAWATDSPSPRHGRRAPVGRGSERTSLRA